MADAPIYKVIFFNQGSIYEVYARQIFQSDLYGFIEIEEMVFGERSAMVVDPSEERLKAEFEGVSRSYIYAYMVGSMKSPNGYWQDQRSLRQQCFISNARLHQPSQTSIQTAVAGDDHLAPVNEPPSGSAGKEDQVISYERFWDECLALGAEYKTSLCTISPCDQIKVVVPAPGGRVSRSPHRGRWQRCVTVLV